MPGVNNAALTVLNFLSRSVGLILRRSRISFFASSEGPSCLLLLFLAAVMVGAPGRYSVLQRDTQIYLPLVRNHSAPNVLDNDPLVRTYHLSVSVYPLFLHPFRAGIDRPTALGYLKGLWVLLAWVQLFGLYLVGRAFVPGRVEALIVASIVGVGQMFPGPRLFLFEPEFIPRGCAMSLVCLTLGALATGRFKLGLTSTAIALLFHPIGAVPGLVSLAFDKTMRSLFRSYSRVALGLAIVSITLMIGCRLVSHSGPFVDPQWAAIISARTPYVLVSYWRPLWIVEVFVCGASAMWAYGSRKRGPDDSNLSALPIPIMLGLLALPASYLMLETCHLSLALTAQPLRLSTWPLLAFTVALAVFGTLSAVRGDILQSVLVLCVRYYLAAEGTFLGGGGGLNDALNSLKDAIVVAALIATCICASRMVGRPKLAVAGVLSINLVYMYWVPLKFMPAYGIGQTTIALAHWAGSHTKPCSVFAFPDSAETAVPGQFRALSDRAVFVDFLSGGQINYSRAFATTWDDRWRWERASHGLKEYAERGVDYVVYASRRNFQAVPIYENGFYVFPTTREACKQAGSQLR